MKTSEDPGHEVVSGVIRQGPDQAGPERLLGLFGQHWPIEHKASWVLEVTCDEARSHVRYGRVSHHRHQLDALGRGDESRGGLPPFCGAAVVGFRPARDQTRPFNGPGLGPPLVDSR
jgi:hypothetical protein